MVRAVLVVPRYPAQPNRLDGYCDALNRKLAGANIEPRAAAVGQLANVSAALLNPSGAARMHGIEIADAGNFYVAHAGERAQQVGPLAAGADAPHDDFGIRRGSFRKRSVMQSGRRGKSNTRLLEKTAAIGGIHGGILWVEFAGV